MANEAPESSANEPVSPLPLVDQRWVLLDSAHAELAKNNSGVRAARQITERLRNGGLRSMIQRDYPERDSKPEREQLSEPYWDGYELEYARNMLHVFPRERMFRSIFNPGLDLQQQGYTFFVWGPDLKKCFGVEVVASLKAPSQPADPELADAFKRLAADNIATLKEMPAEIAAALKPLVADNPEIMATLKQLAGDNPEIIAALKQLAANNPEIITTLKTEIGALKQIAADSPEQLAAKIADAHKPPDKPEVPKETGEPHKDTKSHRQRGNKPRVSLKQTIALAILADIFPQTRYPKGIPPEFSIQQLVDMVAGKWDAKCDVRVPSGAKRPTPPKWGAMKALLVTFYRDHSRS